MDIAKISNVLKVLQPQPDLKDTAKAMACKPIEAVSLCVEMLQQIRNGQEDGLGCGGGNAVEAIRNLRSFVDAAGTGRPSRERFAELLVHVTQLEADLRRQLEKAHAEPTRQAALQRAVAATEGLKKFTSK